MSEGTKDIRTKWLRPIDCSPAFINQFVETVMQGGEVPIGNLRRGIPMAEMLFFTGIPGSLMGVSAIRHINEDYHKHLFERAGVPEMYNPLSVEVCWLSVLSEYRGRGVWNNNQAARLTYLGNRPYHAIHRVDNNLISNPMRKTVYVQAGSDFYSQTSDDKLRLFVNNHDPVWDKTKRIQYA